jgi:hypothetical protein
MPERPIFTPYARLHAAAAVDDIDHDGIPVLGHGQAQIDPGSVFRFARCGR